MTFKSMKGPSRTYLAVIYNEEYPLDSGQCWGLVLIDATSDNDAAVQLARYGGEMLYGKDCEFVLLPKAFEFPLKDVRRGVPVEASENVTEVIGEWLGVILQSRKTAGRPKTVTAVAPTKDGTGVLIAELTEAGTQKVYQDEREKKVH